MKYKGIMIGTDLEYIPIENVHDIDIDVDDKMVRTTYVEVKGDMRKSTSATFPFDDLVMVRDTDDDYAIEINNGYISGLEAQRKANENSGSQDS